jgi:hypothetical protein
MADICDMGVTLSPCKGHEMTYSNIFKKYDINFLECGTIILWLKKKKVNLAYRLAFITNGSLEQEE